MSLKKEQWIEVECKGEQTGEDYIGRFLIKPYLTHAERADAVRLFEKLTRGIDRTDSERQFLYLLSMISFHIIDKDASWWTNGLDLFDDQPIYEISKKIEEVRTPKKDEPKAEETT